MRRKTHEEFMLEFKVKHPTLDMLGVYINNRTRVHVKCKECGHEWEPKASSLYMGHGCPKCYGNAKFTNEEFIEKLKKVNDTVMPLEKYINSQTKIKFKCKICGHEWETIPNAVLQGTKCAKCAGTLKKTHEEFINSVSHIHPHIEVLETYINNHTKLKCHCTKCNGYFYGVPHSMIDAGTGCPYCDYRISHGEQQIRNFLELNHITYYREYRFNDCKDKIPLPFDFYLPDCNLAIEYDGKQHFEPTDMFGGEETFKKTQLHDNIKNKYCLEKNIELLRISYIDYENIQEILTERLIN